MLNRHIIITDSDFKAESPSALTGAVDVIVDLDYAIDRVSWATKASRLEAAASVTVSNCLLASPDELRQCEIDLAAVPCHLQLNSSMPCRSMIE